jgi:1-acyl-sn-glycerol-3-phosphate acyltransferase
VLVLFPEGERSIDGQIKQFKKGASILAVHLRVPIVPVALDGPFAIWPRGRGPQRLAQVRMRFGASMPPPPPLPAKASVAQAEAHYRAATEQLRGAVEEIWRSLQPATLAEPMTGG